MLQMIITFIKQKILKQSKHEKLNLLVIVQTQKRKKVKEEGHRWQQQHLMGSTEKASSKILKVMMIRTLIQLQR